MAKLRLKILTPNKTVFDDTVDMVVLTTTDGEMGVLPGHQAFSATLGYGATKVYNDDNITPYAVFGGFASITNEGVSIMADIAESADEIDAERAKQALERAERRIKEKTSNWNEIRLKNALAKAQVRLKICEESIKTNKSS